MKAARMQAARTAEAKTCTTCRHWEPSHPTLGFCERTRQRPNGVSVSPKSIAVVYTYLESEAVLETQGHFGCNQWEKSS